ncbi:hypothetical protein OUZ56_031944 [Daphnia magna]|uniref:Uncharacterized protein n=1 Tax=Daphnia magna TaxID=35525 RepID=A0ABQ9ZVN8_9CRUS|nr:hypothetical protein OUZ56_031944 [Daphnia magna]
MHCKQEMSHPLLGQSCDRGEEIIGRSPLQERYADMQSGRGVIRATPMPKRTNPRLPSCPRDPSRRLHPLRELSSVPDHLTEEADSRGESVETARGLDSDPETEIDLRAATSPVVPAVGQQFVVPSRHIEQPQRQAMEGVRKFISSLIFRKSSEEVAHQLMERFEEYSTHNRWGVIGKNNNFEKYFDDAARSWFKCARLPNEWMVNLKRPEDMRLQRLFRG